ncbi:[Clostridium sp. D2Q-14]|uniref:[FeFe] hydrogenase H-cluster radical SAM maturase HydG n=1 Tax=Anaeromonas gelatinilytica TaxID=2683194 RepID=UPI00193BF34C|nr:[FeFe] hydrogenase H-cluster radical SAM maturase HydG [Anaeromonas gelatinilytica]MBS4534028.1 [FeFe] hydrogenase H-cluster radical SAM maturase HydG [Anaeromonas gelatinilytica]
MFINHEYIQNLLVSAKNVTKEDINKILDKAEKQKGLTHREIALLLQTNDSDQLNRIFQIAGDIKKSIYGNRIVVFAPLYISNYCVNNCKYCGYKRDNDFCRKKLSMEEIEEEVKILEKLGHKRLALEAGEDPINCPIDYILDSIDTIYNTKLDNGTIRRINVNIAATTVENYKKLKEKGIGTYILFQETYHQPTYSDMHPKSLKGDYEYHLTAFDRAMKGSIDDVGGGVLFGLYDYKFEVLSLMLHNEHLENKYGVGFHTISVPRLKKADGMSMEEFPYLVNDDEFKKIVAIIRLAVPFTGLILSTRESLEIRQEVIKYGVSQVSAGSCTGVGGYKEHDMELEVDQFKLDDHRSPMEVLKSLMKHGYIPSYCTACYRNGRTGDRFMKLAKSGEIQHVCQPNAMMTLMEYALDYGDKEFMAMANKVISQELNNIQREDIKTLLVNNLEKLKNGERDLFL